MHGAVNNVMCCRDSFLGLRSLVPREGVGRDWDGWLNECAKGYEVVVSCLLSGDSSGREETSQVHGVTYR